MEFFSHLWITFATPQKADRQIFWFFYLIRHLSPFNVKGTWCCVSFHPNPSWKSTRKIFPPSMMLRTYSMHDVDSLHGLNFPFLLLLTWPVFQCIRIVAAKEGRKTNVCQRTNNSSVQDDKKPGRGNLSHNFHSDFGLNKKNKFTLFQK